MFELNGELFEDEISFLDAAKKEYASGDAQYVLDQLEKYGFDKSDLNI